MSVNLCPLAAAQLELSTGLPAVGNLLFFYVAGSSTKATTYTDYTGATPNTNPLVLNSLGMPTTEIWLTNGVTYDIVYAPSNDTDPPTSTIRTWHSWKGINDTTSAAADQWVASGFTPTYVSATSFTVPGDQRSSLEAGRRIKSTNTGGTIYSTIQSSAFGALTTVVVTNDSGTLDAGLSAVSYGLLTASNSSIPYLGFAPPGTLFDYAGATAPTGWLKCDGSAISRTAYAALFAAVATTWGVGDGVTTFNIPNFNRKTSIGSGGAGTGTIGNAVGNTGGEETHVLLTAEMATHTHTLSSGTISAAFTGTAFTMKQASGAGANDQIAQGTGANAAQTFTPTGSIAGSVSALTLNNAGSDTAHNNIQPSNVVTKIIKV